MTMGRRTGAHNINGQTHVRPWWAALAVWGVVNAVNVLQAAGFLSRGYTNSIAVNHLLGYVMIALALPTALALVAFLRARAAWLQWIGSAVFLAFIALMGVVDYLRPVEFRSPARTEILLPYLVLFFGSILLMGLPMFRINRNLWLVTVVTSMLLVGAMAVAMVEGVG